ncbi:MAG: hypothetical protein PV344_09125, partial [Anaplasma sp.]|nr:hypothetical protein [Anaplasma sp.]
EEPLIYCKRLNFRGLKFSRIGPKLKIAGPNFRELNVASVLLTYCPNFSRDLFFANQKRFAKFAKIRSSRKFSRLQYAITAFLKAPCVYIANLHSGVQTELL